MSGQNVISVNLLVITISGIAIVTILSSIIFPIAAILIHTASATNL